MDGVIQDVFFVGSPLLFILLGFRNVATAQQIQEDALRHYDSTPVSSPLSMLPRSWYASGEFRWRIRLGGILFLVVGALLLIFVSIPHIANRLQG